MQDKRMRREIKAADYGDYRMKRDSRKNIKKQGKNVKKTKQKKKNPIKVTGIITAINTASNSIRYWYQAGRSLYIKQPANLS